MTVNGWTVRKEFYADGPSMFVWVAVCPGGREEFPLRRDAIAYARTHAAAACPLGPEPRATRPVEYAWCAECQRVRKSTVGCLQVAR